MLRTLLWDINWNSGTWVIPKCGVPAVDRAVMPCQKLNFLTIVFIEVEVSFDSVSKVLLKFQ